MPRFLRADQKLRLRIGRFRRATGACHVRGYLFFRQGIPDAAAETASALTGVVGLEDLCGPLLFRENTLSRLKSAVHGVISSLHAPNMAMPPSSFALSRHQIAMHVSTRQCTPQDVRCNRQYVRCTVRNARYTLSSGQCSVSRSRCSDRNVQRTATNARCRASDVRCCASNKRHRAEKALCGTEKVLCRVSHP